MDRVPEASTLLEESRSGTSPIAKGEYVTETSRTVHPLPCSTAHNASTNGPKLSSVIACLSFPVRRQVVSRTFRVSMGRSILPKCTACKYFDKAEISTCHHFEW